MKSQLTIDARWLKGGIGTYTRHLLEGLGKHGNGFDVHAITRGEHRREVEQWCPRVSVVDARIYTAREQWAVPWAARGCGLLHVPHYNAPLFERAPMVITIHDVIHLTDPAYGRSFKAWAYARLMLYKAARKAARIITVSEYSKDQIIERLDVPNAKVSTIPNGADKEFLPMDKGTAFRRVSTALGIRGPYLLFVGGLKPHKNVATLLRAFALLRERREISQRLVILGHGERVYDELVRECVRLQIGPWVDFVAPVHRALLPQVYAAADTLVMPSTAEGFGLPVLEAMACGTPVICSQAASLPEVGGDAALYFDPRSVEGLADAMERLLDSTELREAMRNKGLAQASRFTWKESVERHIQVYRAALG